MDILKITEIMKQAEQAGEDIIIFKDMENAHQGIIELMPETPQCIRMDAAENDNLNALLQEQGYIKYSSTGHITDEYWVESTEKYKKCA
jgi:hypothetical protein